MKRVLLLDLEETIIPAWGNFFPIIHKCMAIESFVKEFKPDEVITFSWAIWNDKDIVELEPELPFLEKHIGCKFNKIITIEGYIDLVKQYARLPGMDFQDFFDFYEKEKCLFDLCMNGWKPDSHIVLIDDVVVECKIEIPKHNTLIEIKNIEKMA